MPRRFDVAFLLIAIFSLAASFCEPALWMMAVKPLPTLWLAYMAHRFTRGRSGLVLAVACGAVGDSLLAPHRKALFPAGLLAFLVGHLFYIAAFTRGRRLRRGMLAPTIPLVAGVLVLTVFVYRSMSARGEAGEFLGVAVYMCILVTMAIVAIVRENRSWRIPAGAVLFVLSDAHIALNVLISTAPRSDLDVSGIATYYAAQYLIVKGSILEGEPL